MSAFNQYIVILATATIFLTASTHAFGVSGDLCGHADFPVLCRTIVNKKMSASAATIAAIQSMIRQTSSAKLSMFRMRADKQSLDVCKDVYDEAISSLQAAMTYVKKRDGRSLNINLSAALSDYVTCEDGFSGPNPLGDVNTRLKQLASNALALSDEMHLP